jgi:hypothetical protein
MSGLVDPKSHVVLRTGERCPRFLEGHSRRSLAGLISCHLEGLIARVALTIIVILSNNEAFAASSFPILEQEIDFHISAGSLEAALLEWSCQTRIQVVITPAAARISVAAVEGRRNAHDVLVALLSNTGLTFSIVADTVSISSLTSPTDPMPVRPHR